MTTKPERKRRAAYDATSPVAIAEALNGDTATAGDPLRTIVAAPTSHAAVYPGARVTTALGSVPRPATLPPGPVGIGTVGTMPYRDRVKVRSGWEELLVFRVGAELFGIPLCRVEEAVELSAVHRVPESAGSALGVVDLRGRMVPLFSPHRALGVAAATVTAMLVLRDGARRVGFAIDDVDDVLRADLGALRPPPDGDAGDGVLLAIAHRGADLVGLLDADLFLASCLADSRTTETAA